MMKRAARLLLQPLCLSATLLVLPLCAQTHRVEKPESVTRAVAVYEYVGDLAKPTAARLIPVSLFYGGHFEDAGTYLARPVPLALQSDTAYELETSGLRTGVLDLAFARNFRQNTADATSSFDDGWFGYGKIQPPRAKPAVVASKTPGKSTGHAYEVQDDGKPHFGSKPDANDSTSRRAPDPDPADTDRATRISLPDDTRDPKAPDPDRPTLKRSATDTNGGPKQKRQKETSSVTATPPSPDGDPDRPSLKRKGAGETENSGIPPDPSELASKATARGAGGTVTGSQPMIDDNNRPGLHRGKPTSAPPAEELAAVDLPKFNGRIPLTDLKQTVAVSDLHDIAAHDFTYHFGTDADRASVLQGMEALAVAVLQNPALATDAPDFVKNAKPGADRVGSGGPSFAPSPHAGMDRANAGTTTDQPPKKLPPSATPAQRAAARRAAAAAVRRASATATAATALADEKLVAYQLSYGAPATYVFTARTADGTDPVHYVAVVAQPDPDGNGKLQIGMRSTTDSAHLDRTPRYRLVDAVDADASNRASLLFEVRNNSSRQFALFRLLGPHPDALFETGSTK